MPSSSPPPPPPSSSAGGSSLLKRTGGTEGFYRQAALLGLGGGGGGGGGGGTSTSAAAVLLPTPPSAASFVPPPPSSQRMEERSTSLSGRRKGQGGSSSAPSSGNYLMAPGELGRRQTSQSFAESDGGAAAGSSSGNSAAAAAAAATDATTTTSSSSTATDPTTRRQQRTPPAPPLSSSSLRRSGPNHHGTIHPGPCLPSLRHRYRRANAALQRQCTNRGGSITTSTGRGRRSSAQEEEMEAVPESNSTSTAKKAATTTTTAPTTTTTTTLVALSHHAGTHVAFVARPRRLVAIDCHTQLILQEFIADKDFLPRSGDEATATTSPRHSRGLPARSAGTAAAAGATIHSLAASTDGSGIVAVMVAVRAEVTAAVAAAVAVATEITSDLSTVSEPPQKLMLGLLVPTRGGPSPASSVPRIQWEVAFAVDLYPVFYDTSTVAPATNVEPQREIPPVALSLSCSRILVSHQSQVAVVDLATGALLWTHRMPARVLQATMSGDGQAIAISLESSGRRSGSSHTSPRTPLAEAGDVDCDDDYDDDEYEGTGVYTFERDWEDGADVSGVLVAPTATEDEVDEAVRAGNEPQGAAADDARPLPTRMSKPASAAAARKWRQTSLGVVYRPSPFLVQNAKISQLAFRGLGHEFSSLTTASSYAANSARGSSAGNGESSRRASATSVTSATDADIAGDKESEGCDLLLVVAGASAKIYTQNSWRLLVEWTVGLAALPSSSSLTRVDFVPGTIAMTLGDLDNVRRTKNRRPNKAALVTSALGSAATSAASSAASSRRPSLEHATGGGAGGGGVAGAGSNGLLLTDTIGKRGGFHTHHYPSIPSAHNTPLSNAGAWLSEITVEPDRVSLRLSRLTYLKRGMDDLCPTLFENISTVLHQPSLLAAASLPSPLRQLQQHQHFAIQGVWPAWSPWTAKDGPGSATSPANAGSSGSSVDVTETLRGSAMAALGLSPAGGGAPLSPASGIIGDPILSSTQTPPCQLRIFSSHPGTGDASFLDFMVLGDSNDWTSLELSNPRRSQWCVGDDDPVGASDSSAVEAPPQPPEPPPAIEDGWDLESSRIVARVEPGSPYSVRFTWRRHGTMQLVPTTWMEDVDPGVAARLLRENTKWFKDESLLPVPCSLPSCSLDPDVGNEIVAVRWWPDANVGDALLLVALDLSGTLRVLEVPPPWSYHEPMSLRSSAASDADSREESTEPEPRIARSMSTYDVLITPHPEYGLGLRLEVTTDGEPAVAGSFKRHPLTGESLPAEKTGMVMLGDEIVSADGVTLQAKPFDEIIATVRDLGAASSGKPMRITFRRQALSSIPPPPSTPLLSSPSTRKDSPGSPSTRRTVQEIIGIRSKCDDADPAEAMRSDVQPTVSPSPKAASVDGDRTSSISLVATFPRAFSGLSINDGAVRRPLHMVATPLESGPSTQSITLHVSSGGNFESACVSQDMESGAFSFERSPSWCAVDGSRTIVAFEIVPSGSRTGHIVLCDSSGQVSVVEVEVEVASESNQISFGTSHDAFRLDATDKLQIRGSSPDLIATASCTSRFGYDTVSVWSANPHPGSLQATGESLHYSSTTIRSDSEEIVSFEFVRTGFLDASPALIAFGSTRATMYCRQHPCAEWLATLQVTYVASVPVRTSTPNFFPHLIPSILLAYTSHDEMSNLRADWHPESVLTLLFSDELGVQTALPRSRKLFQWLAGDGGDASDGFLESPLVVASMAAIGGENDSNGTDDGKVEASVPLFLDTITNRCCDAGGRSAAGGGARDFPLFRSFKVEDLQILRSCCDITVDPPSLLSFDSCGQHFVAASALFHRLGESLEGKENLSKPATPVAPPRVLVKTLSYAKDESTLVHASIAASGCLAALLSNSQSGLIEHCRKTKLDWSLARSLRMPFWVRSDHALAKISEEIGQAVYRDKRDVMEAALFFVIARKTRTLTNLAAADQSENGRKLFQFMSRHDFSSERGRRAAEKNAYSLLRKCRFREAAAFFLLSDPPALNSALETILTKLRDVDLAFLVARLIESKEFSSMLTGPGHTFGNVLGGGGGYAGTGAPMDVVGPDEVKFQDWKPALGNAAKKLIISRTLPASSQDFPLSAAQLIWLDKREEASWCLSGMLSMSGTAGGTKYLAEIVEQVVSNVRNASSLRNVDSIYKARSKASAVIDMMSTPKLLKAMGANRRALLAGCLTSASAALIQGLEIDGLRFLNLSEPGSEHDDHDPSKQRAASPSPPANQVAESLESSIFDDFAAAPPAKVVTPISTATMAVQSSIFDSFDVPTNITKPSAPTPVSETVESSIFADFDAPPSKPKSVPLAPTMESSIFDAFDAPRPPPKATQDPSFHSPAPSTANHASGTMESSIFAGFDAPPPQPQAAPTPTVGAMESSIFDTFNTPHPAARPTVMVEERASAPGAAGARGQKTTPHSLLATDPYASPTAPRVTERVKDEEVPELNVEVPRLPTPNLWRVWKSNLQHTLAARRLLREIATVMAQFHGDPSDPSISDFYKAADPLVPSGDSGILQVVCDATEVLGKVRQSLDDLASLSGVESDAIIVRALRLLGPSHQQHRMLFAVVLHASSGRQDLAENVIRSASFDLMRLCQVPAVSFDHLIHQRRSKGHVSSQFLRRQAARVSWQLETCLWLHRGGCIPLSSSAFKEAVVAVRVGLLVASWNHNHGCLEAMIRSDPDCQLDDDAGRHLWTSLKIIPATQASRVADSKPKSSGGWEFLVDCRRSEATRMLREKRTGTFIIRPHSGDTGVFTLSFKTNLVPNDDVEGLDAEARGAVESAALSGDDLSETEAATSGTRNRKTASKRVKKDDVVQHAIVRLSESGYRCGSFGPFTTLISLLEAVSESLPFNLRFDLPPTQSVIQEEGTQPSPNAVFLRKLALSHADSVVSNTPEPSVLFPSSLAVGGAGSDPDIEGDHRRTGFGIFLELLVLSAVRKQLASVAVASYDDEEEASSGDDNDDDDEEEEIDCLSNGNGSVSSLVDATAAVVDPSKDRVLSAFRLLQPILEWCRSLEALVAHELAPNLPKLLRETIESKPVDIAQSGEAYEAAPQSGLCTIDGGDALLRKMIQRDSGVDFTTLRLVESGECTIVVIFSKKDTLEWLVAHGVEDSEGSALARLKRMENRRVIEAIDVSKLKLKAKEAAHFRGNNGIRYRILDPWEVEALASWEGETLGASLGRERFLGFNLGRVGLASETVFRSLGGLPLLTLWTSTKGGVALTKALASVHPPWERGSGGDLRYAHGVLTEPPPFLNSLRQHMYRNALFRRLGMPQRFLSLVQVELLDLKNLTAPGGSLSMSVYALLRLKRDGSQVQASLTNKARTLDTAATNPVKLGKTSGPNAPASWGSVVRFRFPLPEQATVDGASYDRDREQLFKGPPTVLQVSVYEKKLLVDHSLGTADVKMDGLWSGGQLEEWVPLRSDKHGISWFARVRLTLRFELMCLSSPTDDTGDAGTGPSPLGDDDVATAAPSVGLRKIFELSKSGGASAHEDVRRSVSSPDLLTYFESMVY